MNLNKNFISVCISAMFFLSFMTSCGCNDKNSAKHPVERPPLPSLPDFNADSAYGFVKAQCDFGPRVPNTKEHKACGDYLVAKMNEWCDTVISQTGMVTAFDGTRLNFRNIISSFNPGTKRRILLFAHWDTRPWADQDTIDTKKPALGADDGGSGVSVLMEIARLLKSNRPDIGVDLIFFDAEDWGKSGGGSEADDSYALGTQYWTKNLHVPDYRADYGILLDMVGSRQAQFRREGFSKSEAGYVIERVWNIANRLGYGSYFLYEDGGYVTDDHVYVNEINIPSIDIINSRMGTRSGFGEHWHTHRDNMDIIDRGTLKAVGQTIIAVIYYPESV